MRSDFEASLEEEDDLILKHPIADESHRAADFCLVGRFLTNQNINFNAMKNRLADIWKPVKGVTIKSIGQGRYLFEFYHKLDVLRVMNGLPWSFNNHPLLLHHVQRGEYALRVPLNSLHMWVQVFDIPHGFISKIFVRQIGNFLGFFVEYNKSNSIGAWRNYMRIRVSIDVSLPLKHFKSIRGGEGGSFWITFKFGVGVSSPWLKDGQTQEHGNVRGGSVGTPNVGMHGDSGTREGSEQVNGGNLAMALTTVGAIHNNPMYEEGGMHGMHGLSDLELHDERKRKRGKMIVGMVPVRSTDDTNEHFLEMGPGYGTCPE
ncbi:hypothetical protein ACS0TY_004230 [Phlomoides rotata]